MAEHYENYLSLRIAHHKLDLAAERDRKVYGRLRRMQADLPWWYGSMFIGCHMHHLIIRARIGWYRLQLRMLALTLPKRLRRML